VTPKTDALLIRLTPADKARLRRVAEAQYLDVSTWARQVLLQAAAALEAERPSGPAAKPRRRGSKR
jgi:hypothetical protein